MNKLKVKALAFTLLIMGFWIGVTAFLFSYPVMFFKIAVILIGLYLAYVTYKEVYSEMRWREWNK